MYINSASLLRVFIFFPEYLSYSGCFYPLLSYYEAREGIYLNNFFCLIFGEIVLQRLKWAPQS